MMFCCILIFTLIRTVQRDLDALEQWSIKWQMPFNPSKCELLRITQKKNPVTHSYTCYNIGELTSAHFKKKITTNNIAHP